MRRLLLVDIDGVLADCEHRLHFLRDKDYDSFYGPEMMNDALIPEGKALLRSLYDWRDSDKLVYLTSRPERTRKMTLGWLAMNGLPVPGESFGNIELLMRPDHDWRRCEDMKVIQLKKGKAFAHKRGQKPFDEVFYIDDMPANIDRIKSAYPQVTSLLFEQSRA